MPRLIIAALVATVTWCVILCSCHEPVDQYGSVTVSTRPVVESSSPSELGQELRKGEPDYVGEEVDVEIIYQPLPVIHVNWDRTPKPWQGK